MKLTEEPLRIENEHDALAELVIAIECVLEADNDIGLYVATAHLKRVYTAANEILARP